MFWSHQEVFGGGTSFKVHLYPMFAANLLYALTQSSVVWNYYVWILVVFSSRFCFVAFSLFWAGFLVLIVILLKAHIGYLHLVSALCRWSSSCCSSWGFEQMV